MENNLHIIVGDPEKQTKYSSIHLPFKVEIVEDIFAEVSTISAEKRQNYL